MDAADIAEAGRSLCSCTDSASPSKSIKSPLRPAIVGWREKGREERGKKREKKNENKKKINEEK